MTRRWLGVLSLAVAVLGVLPAGAQPNPPVCPGEPYNNFNGPQSLMINIHNGGTDPAAQELPYLELFKDGITGVRISPVLPFFAQPGEPDFFKVPPDDPYMDGVFEIFDPDKVLVLVDDGWEEDPHAKPSVEGMLRKLRGVIERYPMVRRIEFMNEPSSFSRISPQEYVVRYLRPARKVIDEYNAQRSEDEKIILYSAAWFGNADGVRETQRMVRAGALAYIDVLSAHIYGPLVQNVRKLAREYKRLARGKPVAVTETNFLRSQTSDYDAQGWWICEAMIKVEELLRRDLAPELRELQHNVFYTLRADEFRRFNVISFEDQRSRFWRTTGPAHFIIRDRSVAVTDPKRPRDGGEEPAGGSAGEGEPEPGFGGPGGRGF